MTHFCNSKATQEFLQIVADDTGIPKNELLYTSGRGKTARVMAHLYIMIYAAEKLSPKFHLEVIKAFVEGKILALRDVSGEMYKELNEKIKETADKVLGKPSHKGHYITVSNLIKNSIGVDDWNTATPAQLDKRVEIEKKLIFALDNGLVTDWAHFKTLIGSCK
jgi:hypothetical protein